MHGTGQGASANIEVFVESAELSGGSKGITSGIFSAGESSAKCGDSFLPQAS
jgi:hypothetical protein